MHGTLRLCGAAIGVALAIGHAPAAQEPIPDKLVVLTFDDSKATHYTVVRPLLEEVRIRRDVLHHRRVHLPHEQG